MRYFYYLLSAVIVSCLFGALMSYIAYADGGNQLEYRTAEGGVVWRNIMPMFFSAALISFPVSLILGAAVYVISKDVIKTVKECRGKYKRHFVACRVRCLFFTY